MKLFYVVVAVVSAGIVRAQAPIALSASPPAGVALPVLESFISFSIEFSSFPDFAGTCRESLDSIICSADQPKATLLIPTSSLTI